MRMAVKPHQAFFPAARTVHAATDSAVASLLCLPQRSFPYAALPARRVRGERRREKNAPLHSVALLAAAPHVCPVGWRVLSPGTTPGLPSIRVGPATAPAPFTVYALGVRHASKSRAHPSNERCLSRITRRQNGGPLRPHRTSSDLIGPHGDGDVCSLCLLGRSLVSLLPPPLTPPLPAPG